jgi:hypothetical protein
MGCRQDRRRRFPDRRRVGDSADQAKATSMLFMVIERFKERDPKPIDARFHEHGRALPEGLRYLDSLVEANFDRCFQVMECDDAALLQQWILQWFDLVEFEIVPVSPSKAVRELFPTRAS